MRILFVCTGNTCRSPLAEAVLRQELERRAIGGVEVRSAGTGAWDGAPASEGAYLVALEHGLDLSAHRARLLTRDIVRQSDLILTMSPHHRARAEALGGDGKAQTLVGYASEGEDAEVPDPYGSELDEYRAAFDRLTTLITVAAGRIAAAR